MKNKICFNEANSEILHKSASFFSQIEEYGQANIIANYEHLTWKHLENPHGKSLVSTIEINNEIKAIMFFQKNDYCYEGNKVKYLLATDMAFKKDVRKLSNVLNYWDECINYIKKEYPEFIIIHSSNSISEPIYNKFFKEFKVATIKAKIFFPRTKVTDHIGVEEKVKDYKLDNWRWSPRSQVKYKTVRNNLTNETELIYRMQKKFGIRVMVIVEINPKILNKRASKIFFTLLILCLREACIAPIFYFYTQKSGSIKHLNNFIEVPKLISKYDFPIYVHNDSKKIINKKDILQLSMLDVM